MSSTAHSGADASSGREHTPTLLGLPAELRNAIYEYTFVAEIKSRLTPHAMTRVNRQTRRESLTMNYESVTYLKIPVDTSRQIARAKKWLAEFDFTVYPVLPTIEFCPLWLTNKLYKAIYWSREERSPAGEVPEFISQVSSMADGLLTDEQLHNIALRALYEACLGELKVKLFQTRGGLPERFAHVVNEGGTWITRSLHMEAPSRHIQCLDLGEDGLSMVMRGIAIRNEGRDWDKNDLEEIVEWFEYDLSRRVGDSA